MVFRVKQIKKWFNFTQSSIFLVYVRSVSISNPFLARLHDTVKTLVKPWFQHLYVGHG
ncbi:hypothetical protein AtDm6_0224 [Acetobacter tropicalis]|uniref:Uncharacterized protein n=1 Tax=Acetobacter tropicalis TaxID=104102 RepID=A0A094Z096_9PROT|nr:hypothetical protein AtDm6_0224 [Acetobacter tropicalis]